MESAMSRSTISTFQLFEMFPDAEAARKYLEETMWPHGPVCPECGSLDRITTRKGGYYRCNPCKLDFTIRTGTIFGRSHNPAAQVGLRDVPADDRPQGDQQPS